MDSTVKQNWKCTLIKIVSKFSENLGNYETRENAFDKIHERLFFVEFSVSFRKIFGKFVNQQKTLGK